MGDVARPPKKRRITPSAVLAAAMLGLAEALEGKKRPEEPAIIETAVGGDGDPIELHLGDEPRRAIAFIRPWLRRT